MSRRRPAAFAPALVLSVLLCEHTAGFAQIKEHNVSLSSPLEVIDVFAGIVHYTRWPKAVDSLRLCVSDKDIKATATAVRFSQDSAEPRHVTVQTIHNDAAGIASLLDCQIVYMDDIPESTWQAWLPGLVGHPILTIGRGEAFCSWGGLFCLDEAPARLRLHANLDSIARSELHVNPQLLRLTQADAS